MANATATELQELYVAYFGRAADPTGLDYWTETGITQAAFAASMHAQKEFQSEYGSLSVEAQVNQIYKNLFDREADVTGLTYWTQEINLGNLKLAEIAEHLIYAAKNNAGSEDDKTALENKTSAAVAYTAKVKETTAAILAFAPESSDPWVAGDNITEAKSYLSGIDKDTTHTAADIAASVTTITNNGTQDNKKSFAFTTGIDDFEGGSGADTFDASTTKNSLTTGDTLDGGSGADTLTAHFDTNDSTVAVNSKNIETFNVAMLTNGKTATVNMVSASGVTKIGSSGSIGALVFNDLGSIPTVDISSQTSEATTINFTNAALAGTADDLQINLASVSTATITLGTSTGATNTLETLSLKSSSTANTFDTNGLATNGAGVVKLEITGDQNLTLDTLASKLVTVAGGDFTADLKLTTSASGTAVTSGSGNDTITGAAGNDNITAGAGNDVLDAKNGDNTISGGAGNDIITAGDDKDSVDAGAGDDTFKVAAAKIESTDTIAGGAGTDTFELQTAAAVIDADFTGVTGFENLAVKATIKADVTLEGEAAEAGFSKVTLTDDDAVDTLTVKAGFTNDLEVVLDEDTSGANKVVGTGYTKSLTITAKDTDLDDEGSNAVTTLTGGSGTDTLAISGTAKSAAAIATADMGSVTAIEKITLSPGTAGTAGTENSVSLTLHDANVADSTASTFYSLTVDASAMTTGSATINAAAEGGGDATLGGKVSIIGGAGNDTITGTVGTLFADTIEAGAGNDTILVAAAQIDKKSSIAGGAGTDSIGLAADASFEDVDFTNVTGVETLKNDTDIRMVATVLGTKADAAGIRTIELTDTGGVDKVTIGSDFTSDLTLILDSDATNKNTVVATDYTGTLTVQATDDELDTTDAEVTGGKGTNTLEVTTTKKAGVVADDTTGLLNFDTVKAVIGTEQTAGTENAFKFTMANQMATWTDASTYQTLTIDASALTAATATINAVAEVDGAVSIIGGAGNDSITISKNAKSIGDTVTGGAGNDTFTIANGFLTKLDSIDGGAGTNDVITIADETTLLDAAFTEVSNVEHLLGVSNVGIIATLEGEAAAAGITKVTLLDDNGADDNITVKSGFTNDLEIVLDDDAEINTIDATGYTKTLTVTGKTTDIGDAVNVFTGGSGTNILNLTAAADTIAAAQLAKVKNFDQINLVSTTTADVSITLSDNNATYTDNADYQTLTVDGSALTTGKLTADATAEADGKLIIKGGGAVDTLTISQSANFGDSISGGAGDDDFIGHATAGNIKSIDSLDGGAGTDTLTLGVDESLTDGNFTNFTSIEKLAAGTNFEFTSLALGAEADEMGLIDLSTKAGNAGSKITLAAAFNNDLAIQMTDANVVDTIDGSASAAKLTITATNMQDLGTADVIKGGTGSSDSLTVAASAHTYDMSKTSGIEKVVVTNADSTATGIKLTAVDTVIADGKTLEIDASALTHASSTFTFTGNAAETDGYLKITGSETKDTIYGGGLADTINGGSGIDVIDGLKGADSLTGGAGADNFIFDVVNKSTTTGADEITDYTSGTDSLSFTIDHSSAFTDLTISAKIQTAAAGTTAAQANLSGKIGEYIYDTTNSKLYVNVNADNLVTTQDYAVKINAATTAANTIANGDLDFTIKGGTGSDTIDADSKAVISVDGGAGTDSITGGVGADTIKGDAGNDTIIGGDGADSIDVGDGAVNVVKFGDLTSAKTGMDAITSFVLGTGKDKLSIDSFISSVAATNTVAIDATATLSKDYDGDINVVAVGADIGAKDYSDGDFAEMFGAGKAFKGLTSANETTLGVAMKTIIIAQGSVDESHIYYIEFSKGVALTKAGVTKVATIDSKTTWHADNLSTL